jgi:2-hydroxychromene-2-carboxylate isomerase
MKMVTLEYFFDYRSPYSYLSPSQLAKLGAHVSYHPFDIVELMKRVRPGRFAPRSIASRRIGEKKSSAAR